MMRLIAASLLLLSSCATVAERKVVFLDGEQPDEGLVVCAVEKGRYACVRWDTFSAAVTRQHQQDAAENTF